MSFALSGTSRSSSYHLNKFENLPDVILLKIFGFLYVGDLCRVGGVCSRWYRLSRSPGLWKRVDTHDMQLTSYQMQKLVPILPACVVHLQIRGLPILMVPLITPQVAIEIRERCPDLETLIIEDAFVAKHVHFTDITVEDLPQKLSVLSLRKSFFHPDQFFCSVSHPTVPKIKVLDCSQCWCVTDDDIPFFTRLTDLQELYLEDCSITYAGVSLLLKRIENLRILDLEGTRIVDGTVILLATQCQTLEELFLGRTSVGDKDFRVLPAGSLLKLTSLCLMQTPVSNTGLRTVLQRLSSLKALNVALCSSVTSECIAELVATLPLSRRFRINFSGSSENANCHHFYTRKKYLM